MQNYPQFVYKDNEYPKIVETEQEKIDLGSGWVESPEGLQILIVPSVNQ